MKKYIAIALLVVIVVAGYFIFRRQSPKVIVNQNPTISETLKLSSDWKTITDTTTVVKLEKTVTSGLKPEVVYKQTTSKDAATPAKYVDNLKAGARATLSGLVYVTDKRFSQESGYSALLTGYYLNKGKKVTIDQRIFITGQTVNTFSGSSDAGQSAEVSQVLSSLTKSKVGQ